MAKKTKAPKPKMGRPSDYTPELGDRICALMSQGESLNAICKGEDMPSAVSVYAWLRKHDEFFNNYVRAREDQADTLADEIVGIADEKTEDANSRRVRIDARKWVAAKLKPKKYGDKVETTVQGPDGGAVQNKYTIEFVNAASKD